jgi:ATP-dependent DNA ligase I
MLLAEITGTSEAVAATRSRLAKTASLAACLRLLAPEEIEPAVAFLTGELRQRPIGVGWAALRDTPPPAPEPSLSVGEVDETLTRVKELTGPGSATGRKALLAALFGRATGPEQAFLRGLIGGELRQGALEGVMVEAVAKAAEIPAAEVRRAAMLTGRLGRVTHAALVEGVPALRAFRLEIGRALQPMLAGTATGVDDALAKISPAAVEWKVDGARVQVHRDGDEVAVFTRSLDDITARVPEVVEAVLALPVRSIVLDGEVIALRDDGRPHPFQVTASRVGSKLDVERLRGTLPLTTFFFDVLHVDGDDVLDQGGAERFEALRAAVPEPLRIPRQVTSDPAEAAALLRDTIAQGHEGVMVKSLTAPYEAGRRGSGWLKVKPVHTLDLVVLAAEWGHGRRQGWLSNLHLGARDPATGGWVMLGKTFKGLTDKMLTWQTEHLLTLEDRRDSHVVHVRPELVAEIAFDGLQTSPRYPGGLALRFARVLRHRPDKPAAEADTIDTVRAIHAAAGGG